jgi:hypothetical protein
MARQLLANAPLSTVGPWVRTEGGFKRGVPMRIVSTGNFAGSPIIIEELVAGMPGNGTHSPIYPQSDTGTARVLGTIPVAGADLLIEDPVEFIRARTDANLTGTVTYCGAEMIE